MVCGRALTYWDVRPTSAGSNGGGISTTLRWWWLNCIAGWINKLVLRDR